MLSFIKGVGCIQVFFSDCVKCIVMYKLILGMGFRMAYAIFSGIHAMEVARCSHNFYFCQAVFTALFLAMTYLGSVKKTLKATDELVEKGHRLVGMAEITIGIELVLHTLETRGHYFDSSFMLIFSTLVEISMLFYLNFFGEVVCFYCKKNDL